MEQEVLLPGIILCMHPANQRQRYIVTSPLFDMAYTQNDHCTTCTMNTINFKWADPVKLAGPWSTTDEKVRGPVKNVEGRMKLFLYNHVWNCQNLSEKKSIFGPVEYEKFLLCLS